MRSAALASSIIEAPVRDNGRDLIMEATARCVERAGFDGVTVDAIARDSGISRTTIYRRFGDRDGLLRALIDQMTGTYLRRCTEIASGPGSLLKRVERIVVASVSSIEAFPWLKAMLRQGLPQAYLDVFASVQQSRSANVIRPLLEAAEAAGEWVAPDSLDELMNWLLRQILFLGGQDHPDEAAVQHKVRIYVMRVLGGGYSAEAETLSINRKLDDLGLSLAAISRTIRAGTAKA